jgi:hypothetical protein
VNVDPPAAWLWAASIAAALVAFWATRETQYHELALGLLLSSITLLILLSLVELAWQVLDATFGSGHPDSTDGGDRRE